MSVARFFSDFDGKTIEKEYKNKKLRSVLTLGKNLSSKEKTIDFNKIVYLTCF